MDKLRVAEEMSAALRFLEGDDFLAAAYRCDQATNACLVLGGFTFITRIRNKDSETVAEIEDLLSDVKPDRDSEASGTLVERVRALINLVGL